MFKLLPPRCLSAPRPGNSFVQLDRTAFYPEGGDQPCDTGGLGTALVTDVQEHGGVITHTVERSAAGWADGERPH